jgi:hypothetical protein
MTTMALYIYHILKKNEKFPFFYVQTQYFLLILLIILIAELFLLCNIKGAHELIYLTIAMI